MEFTDCLELNGGDCGDKRKECPFNDDGDTRTATSGITLRRQTPCGDIATVHIFCPKPTR